MTTPTPLEARVFARSAWIWPESPHWDIVNGYALFRKAFSLAKVPARAPLFITADQAYRLYVNGAYVARGPARGFQASWPYDEIDVRPWLRRGKNLIAVRAYNPGLSNFQYMSQSFAGLLVAAKWAGVEIVSDASWRAIRQPGVRRDTVPSSLQLFPQEHIDLRVQPEKWMAADFDDAGWSVPAARVWNSAPWFRLEPRGIPMMEEEDVRPVARLGEGEGKCAKGYAEARDVVALRQGETRGHVGATVVAEAGEWVCAATGAGRFRSCLIDFGRTVVGGLVFTVEGAVGSEIVDTHLVETIDAATLTPDQDMEAFCRMAFGDRMVLRAGRNEHVFFHHYGFRYLMVTVRDAAVDVRVSVMLRRVGYPLPRKGVFTTSDAGLARIWEACAWTQQCCSLDAYVDTPWREQAQWWGDARVQAWNTFHLNGDARLFRRGIRQIASQTTPDGVTYGHAPTMAHGCVLPDFTLIWFLTLWDYYWQTGSTEPLEAHEETITRALEYFRTQTDAKSGLVVYDERYWLFLDWTELHRDGAPTVLNLWLLIALERLAELYRVARRPKAAAPLLAWAGRLRRALGELIDADGLMRDGLDRRGVVVATTSIHGQTLAMMAGLGGHDARKALDRVVLPWIRGESGPVARPSAYWATYVFTVLAERGHGAEVIAFIQQHWAAMAEHGTTWENFAPKIASESFSHAWSAHPLYHFMQIIGGVTQTAAAWKGVRFAPVFEGEKGGAVIPTPGGKVVSRWTRRKDGTVEVSLALPKGVTAEVVLPGVAAARRVTGSNRWRVRVGVKE